MHGCFNWYFTGVLRGSVSAHHDFLQIKLLKNLDWSRSFNLLEIFRVCEYILWIHQGFTDLFMRFRSTSCQGHLISCKICSQLTSWNSFSFRRRYMRPCLFQRNAILSTEEISKIQINCPLSCSSSPECGILRLSPFSNQRIFPSRQHFYT